MSNAYLERMRRGELTLTLAIRSSRTADVVRVAHTAGYHSILVDLEHSTMPLDVAAQLCASATDLGLTAFARVPERDYGSIGRLLDCGATGIVAARIEAAAEALTVSRACRFPPRGQRSQIATVPSLGLRPTPAATSNPALDEATIVQVILETPTGIANAEAIAAIDGIDMLAIGANDLTAELGVPGHYRDPRVREAVLSVASACRRHGKLLMIGGISDPSVLDELLPLGVAPMLLVGTDTDLMFTAAQQRAEQFRTWHQQRSRDARLPEGQQG